MRYDGAMHRWFLDPTFGRGYPADLVEWYQGLGLLDGIDPDAVAGQTPPDVLGLNYYRRERIVAARPSAGWGIGADVLPPTGARTGLGWEIHPDGLRAVLARITRDYAPKAIAVTENGASFGDEAVVDGSVQDPERRDYFATHLQAAADAIGEGVPLIGYFAWSLFDNFEWSMGYGSRFGIVHVDFASQHRAVKWSGQWYRALLAATIARAHQSRAPSRAHPRAREGGCIVRRRHAARRFPILLGVGVLIAALVSPVLGVGGTAPGRELGPDTKFAIPIPNPDAIRQIGRLLRDGNRQDAKRIGQMIATPQAEWFTAGTPESTRRDVRRNVVLAAATRRVPVLVAYNIPFRDCAQFSAGGATSRRRVPGLDRRLRRGDRERQGGRDPRARRPRDHPVVRPVRQRRRQRYARVVPAARGRSGDGRVRPLPHAERRCRSAPRAAERERLPRRHAQRVARRRRRGASAARRRVSVGRKAST